VNIIPHTAAETIIGDYQAGTTVNIEVDLLARYLERLLEADDDSGITKDFLRAHGYG
jgi:riboflavin synthase